MCFSPQSSARTYIKPVICHRCQIRVYYTPLTSFSLFCLHRSVAVLTECMRNKALAKFFRERQESLRHSLPLGSYLLKPVQRILKYHLLLHVRLSSLAQNTQKYKQPQKCKCTNPLALMFLSVHYQCQRTGAVHYGSTGEAKCFDIRLSVRVQ